jgi:hypothetical protein
MLWPKALIWLEYSTNTTSKSGPSEPMFTPATMPTFGMADPTEPPLELHFSNKQDALDEFITELDDDHYHDHAPDHEAPGDDVNHEAPGDDVDLMSKASKRHLFKS